MENLKVKHKAQFLSELVISPVKGDDDLFYLRAPLRYESKILKSIVEAEERFVTDLSSVPKWLPVVYALFKTVGKEAAVIHDLLYQKHICGKLKADRVFLEAMKVLKVAAWKRQTIYWGVVTFGWTSYSNGPDRYKILNTKK